MRPVRRCFPGNFEPMTTLFIGATLAALTAISALTTATTLSSSNPCSSRGVWAVHVSCRLRCSCAAQHAAARADPSLRVRRSPRGSSRGGASRGGASRGGASGGERGSVSGGVSSSNTANDRRRCDRRRSQRGPSEREPSEDGQTERDPWQTQCVPSERESSVGVCGLRASE